MGNGRYISICILFAAGVCHALETDQFTLPPRPLVDIGPELQQEVTAALQRAMDRANGQYAEHMANARRTGFDFIRQSELEKANQRLTEGFMARAVFDATVRGGSAVCYMEGWARYGEFDRQPMKFDPSPGESVYDTLTRPILIFILSPTISLDGVYLGTDKLGHIFEQGYEYYEVYARERNRGRDEAAAIRKAVELGVEQEQGVYGLGIDNIYSNADLAANYAGLKFYINLTRPVAINGIKREPILVLENKQWRLNKAAGDNFMRAYITAHLNEAWNPCRYDWPLRLGVRSNVRKLAPRWMEHNGITAEELRQRMVELSRWYGEDYGHSGFEKVVGLVEIQNSTDLASSQK